MTRSFGGPGGRSDDRSGSRSGRGTPREPQPQQQQPSRQPGVEPDRIDIGKRLVALIIDFFACYLVGAAVALVPIVNTFLPLPTVMILVFLCRDFLFEGRGVGKNLMGIQVVDIGSGQPCGLLQSVQRNIVLVAPYVVLTLFDSVLRFVPIPWINETVRNIINLVGMVYCAVVIPIEGYRVYNRQDGLRIGDDIAGTALVEAPMDFSTLLPRQ
jgi:uncharacterized RDD family membrane protein YckC